MATRRKQKPSALRSLALAVEARTAPVQISGLRGASKSAVAAELIRAHAGRPVLLVGASSKSGDALAEDLRTMLGEDPESQRLHSFPRHDTLPYDRFSPQPFVTAQRMNVLYRWLSFGEGLAEEPAPVVVSDWTALALHVPSRKILRARARAIEAGAEQDRDAWVEGLLADGYQRMPMVAEPGEIAVRGGIVDFYPPHGRYPLRIEFFGD